MQPFGEEKYNEIQIQGQTQCKCKGKDSTMNTVIQYFGKTFAQIPTQIQIQIQVQIQRENIKRQ